MFCPNSPLKPTKVVCYSLSSMWKLKQPSKYLSLLIKDSSSELCPIWRRAAFVVVEGAWKGVCTKQPQRRRDLRFSSMKVVSHSNQMSERKTNNPSWLPTRRASCLEKLCKVPRRELVSEVKFIYILDDLFVTSIPRLRPLALSHAPVHLVGLHHLARVTLREQKLCLGDAIQNLMLKVWFILKHLMSKQGEYFLIHFI